MTPVLGLPASDYTTSSLPEVEETTVQDPLANKETRKHVLLGLIVVSFVLMFVSFWSLLALPVLFTLLFANEKSVTDADLDASYDELKKDYNRLNSDPNKNGAQLEEISNMMRKISAERSYRSGVKQGIY